MGCPNEDLARIEVANKMRVDVLVWEGVSPKQFGSDYEERLRFRNELRERTISR